MSYDYEVVPTFTAEGQIINATLGDPNDEGYQRLYLEQKLDIDKSDTFTKKASIRVNFDRFTRPAGGNDDLAPNKLQALNIAKRQFTDLMIATGILRIKKDEKGKAITENNRVVIEGTPITAETVSRLTGRYLKTKMGPSGLDPTQYDFKAFYTPGNGHQNTFDDTPF